MPRRANEKTYAIYYRDGEYKTVNLVKQDYDAITAAWIAGRPVVGITIGAMALAELRSIFVLRDEDIVDNKLTEETEEEEPVYPNMSLEEMSYLWMQEQTAKEETERNKRKTEVVYE